MPNSDVAGAGPLAPKMLCTLGKPPLAGADAKENPPPPAALPAGWNLGGARCYIPSQRTDHHGWRRAVLRAAWSASCINRHSMQCMSLSWLSHATCVVRYEHNVLLHKVL